MYLSKHTLIDQFNDCDSGTGLAPHQPDHTMEVDGEGMGPYQAGETVIIDEQKYVAGAIGQQPFCDSYHHGDLVLAKGSCEGKLAMVHSPKNRTLVSNSTAIQKSRRYPVWR